MNERTDTADLDLAVYRAALGSLRLMVAEHMAEALLGGDDAEHRRTVRLSRRADEAGANLSQLVDEFLTGTYEARLDWAWKSPTARKAPALDSPWDDTPPF